MRENRRCRTPVIFVDTKVADHQLVFCGGGEIRDFAGTYSEYVAWIAQNTKRHANPAPKPHRPPPNPQGGENTGGGAVPAQKLSFNEKRELEALETEIPAREAEEAALEGVALESGNALRWRSSRRSHGA